MRRLQHSQDLVKSARNRVSILAKKWTTARAVYAKEGWTGVLAEIRSRFARSGTRRLQWVHEETQQISGRLWELERRAVRMQEALGRIEARQLAREGSVNLQEREFRVFSQWGEDGIIQFLCEVVPIPRKVFVEFGVESYDEANTRFLLVNNNWAGLVIDGDAAQVARIRQQPEYWLYNLKAVDAFITCENINQILRDNGITGEIGLLSIDIDGMDYWIWEAIHVVEPAIVVVEYNYRFGPHEAVTVPYRADFDRRKAHHSILYYGASLKALCELANRKGYAFVGCGSAGLNAFFVRRDLKPAGIRELTPEEGFVEGQFCEAHDEQGRRIEMSKEEERRLVRELPVIHLNASR